jgi:hypothetical protein
MEAITELTEEELNLVAGGVVIMEGTAPGVSFIAIIGGTALGVSLASGANAMTIATALGSTSSGSGGTAGAGLIT